MVITHKLRPMDLTCKNVTQRVDVMQDDKFSRCLALPIRANGADVELPEDVRAIIRYKKPDGTGGNYDTLPDGTSAYTISGSAITVALAPQVCTVPGMVQMAVCLMRGNAEINTFVILVNVHANPGIDVESQDYTNMRGYIKSYGWPPDKTLRTDADGNVIADDVIGGSATGGYYTPSVDDDGNLTWTASNPGMPEVDGAHIAGKPGKSAYQFAVDGGYTGTEAEFRVKMASEIPAVDDTLTHSGQAADAAVVRQELRSLSEEIVSTAESKVSAHNTGADTHSDIRLLISGLTDRLNALADSDDTTLDQLSEVVAYIKANRELIASITTDKVNVTDIVNDLVTNVANKPLSAAQGVELKKLIDAISIPEKLPNPHALTFTGAVEGSYDGSEEKTINIPSGGGGGVSYRSWSKVWTLEVAEDIAGFTASNIDLDGKSEIMVVFISDSTASRTMVNGRISINGVDVGKVLFNTLALKKDSHTFVIIGRADEGIEYTTMAAKAEYQSYPWQGDVNVVHRMVSGINTVTQWIADSTIEITQGSATLGKGVTIEIYVR